MLAGLSRKIKRGDTRPGLPWINIGEMQDAPSFGSRLREARKRRHLTQRQVGDLLQKTHSAIGQWENGLTIPELETLVAAAQLYETSLDWLIWGGDVGSGIENRIRQVPNILRAALVERLHREIDATIEAAKRLPPGMTSEPVKDRDPRLSEWSARAKQRTKAKGGTQ